MRRAGLVLTVWLLLFCSGCELTQKPTAPCPLPAAFSADVQITQGVFQAAAAMRVRETGETTFTLREPAALQTLEIAVREDGVRFSFLGLLLETPPALLPDASFAASLYAAFEALRSGADCAQTPYGDGTAYTCKTAAGDLFTLTADKNGAPVTLVMESRNLQADFTDFSAE
ncbi:MAG TPA: hypothetical protein IAC53_03080 [Candidatus Fimenecus excrementigallinarum]|uniref:Lipoprotein n=1 Tax=Candidatus Fimenecus excrementigallinarum TaxID=2840816 RepID=A0A9D1LDE1_9FIRM|nr:hypothetical protein [Candidatus Fimenecus excrementigallinarum]